MPNATIFDPGTLPFRMTVPFSLIKIQLPTPTDLTQSRENPKCLYLTEEGKREEKRIYKRAFRLDKWTDGQTKQEGAVRVDTCRHIKRQTNGWLVSRE